MFENTLDFGDPYASICMPTRNEVREAERVAAVKAKEVTKVARGEISVKRREMRK